MDSRIAVIEEQILALKEGKDGLVSADKELTDKINILNIKIPQLTESIKNLTDRINNHEANAESRSKDLVGHKLRCGETATKATIALWLIGIIFALIGGVFTMLSKIK